MKKLLSVLLALAMLVSVISVPAFADGETLSVVYHYKDATTRADVTRDGDVTGLAAGGKYAIDFVAPYTQEEYFVGWYLTPDFSGEQVEKEITLADGVNNIYAKYQTYQQVTNLIIPNKFNYEDKANTYTYYPNMLYNYGYTKWVEAGRSWVGTIVHDPETTNTTVTSDGSNATHTTFITDVNRTYVAARPGTSYKLTFEAKASGSGANIRFGAGIAISAADGDFKYQTWGANTMAVNGDPKVYGDYIGLSTGDEYKTYTAKIDIPATYPADAHNFFLLKLKAAAAGGTIDIKNMVLEQVSVEYYVGDTLINKEYPASGTTVTPPALDEQYIPEGKVFSGWYLDEDFTQSASGVKVEGAVKLYAKVGDLPKVKYMAGDTVVKEETVDFGDTYTPENFMLDAQYIPDGYYFTGWYHDEACTQPVKAADLTKEVTIAGDYVRYAGLREYEKEFSPTTYKDGAMPSTINQMYYSVYALQYPHVRSGGIYLNFIQNRVQTTALTMTTDGEDTIISTPVAVQDAWIFNDANGDAFQAKPGAKYIITYQYRYTGDAPADTTMRAAVGLPVGGEIVSTSANIVIQGYRLSNGMNYDGYSMGPVMTWTKAAGEWEDYRAEVTAPATDSDYYPLFFIRNNRAYASTTVEYKNIKVEMVTAKVNLHYAGQVDTVKVIPGETYLPEDPTHPDGKEFEGWFLDSAYETAMPAEGIVVNEDTNLYAKFHEDAPVEDSTVVYHYADAVTGADATREVTEGLTAGETFAIDFRAPNTSEKYFTGWYTNEACTGDPVASITVADGVNNLYAGYEEFKTVMRLTPYDSSTARMKTPLMGGGVYHTDVTPTSLGYAKINVGEEADGSVYWLRDQAADSGSSQSYPILDENGVAFQARAGAKYKFSAKIKGNGENAAYMQVAVGKPAGSLQASGVWSGESPYRAPIAANKVTLADRDAFRRATDWTLYSAIVEVKELADDALFYVYFTEFQAGAQCYVKDLVIEEIIPEELSVVYHYLDENGVETEKVVKDGLTLNQNYAIDWIANNTNEKYFVGWYNNAECTGTPVTTVTLVAEQKHHVYARYEEYKTTFSPVFNHAYDNYPHTIMPSLYDGKYITRTGIVNYSLGGVKTVTDAAGNYYSIDSNGSTMIFFPDGNDIAYQAKPGAQYKITITYKYDSGDGFSLYGAVGMPRSSVTGTISWTGAAKYGDNRNAAAFSEPKVEVVAEDAWKTVTVIVDASAVDYSQNSAQIGIFLDEFTSGEKFYFKDIVVEEYTGNVGEYSEQLNGVVYELGEVADGKTYAVTFNYKGDAANFGFFTADKEEAGVYTNVGYVDGNKIVLAVNGDGTYTAFITVDKAAGQGATLYMYAKDVETAGVVSGETVTDLGDVITNEGASILTGKTSAQAIRYYFGYDTTDGKDIIINGVSYEVKERGFLFANGAGKLDDGAYVGAPGFVNKAVSGDALANCWQAEEIDDTKSNIWFSTYVVGFAADDTRELFVKGYITFIVDGAEFTVYAGASNGSVATIAALQ